MRIAFVTREYPPETAWGGIGAFYASLAVSLAEAGHDVEVFTQGIEAEQETVEDGVTVRRVLGLRDGFGPSAPGAMAGNDDIGLFALGLARAMHRAVARRHAEAPFDVIEGHEHLGINTFINADSGLQALKVTRYHSAYHTLVKRGLADWPVSRLVESLERGSIRSADLRISTSEVISRITREDFDVPRADAIIPNFVKSSVPGTGWSRKKDQALFVGRLVLAHKRPDLAVQAFCAFARSRPGWRMVVAGPDQDHAGHGTVWAYVKSLIPKGLADRIDYVGAQPREGIDRLMDESKVLIMPSDFESFGMVAIEAMQRGCLPLVSSDTATADVVPDSRLIRRRGDAADIAAGLEALFDDEATSGAAVLSGKAERHAHEHFSQTRLIEQNLEVFSAALRGRGGRREAPAASAESLPLVSVIIPNFNGGRFLEETLSSVVSQDYPRLEIILVDGGSSDDSMKIAERFPDVIVIREKDTGQAHAINRGLLRASGDILAYLNSDDLYRPLAVRAVVEHFRADPGARILCGACDYIDERSEVVGSLIQPRFSGQAGIIRYWGWGKWHTLPQQSVFWRREVTERIGLFDASLHYVMDLDYWIRAAGLFDVKLVPDTLAAFRLVEGTKTVSQTDRMYAEEYAAFRRYRHLLPVWRRPLESIAAARHYSRKLLDFAEHLYLEARFRRRALPLFVEAVKVFPPRIVDIRVWLMAGNVAASALRLGGLADRVHRRVLRTLWRMRGG